MLLAVPPGFADTSLVNPTPVLMGRTPGTILWGARDIYL